MISIIIPTYNRAKFIKRAIDSALDQTYQNFEIIIVDDGSTDNTKEVLTDYINQGKMKYIYEKNSGPGIARNAGVEHAKGELVAFLDSDDEWMPDKLEKQIKILESRGKDAAVFSNIEYIDENGNKIGELFLKARPYEGKILKQLLIENFIATSSVIAPKHMIKEADGFARNRRLFAIGEDHLLWLKIADKAEFYFISEPLVKYHVHGEQIVNNKFKMISSLIFKFIYLFKHASLFNNITRKEMFFAFLRKIKN